MRLLSRYIQRHIWPPALLAALVICFLVIAGAIREQLDVLFTELPIAQITLGDISRISLYAVPSLVAYIVPITFLMGIMLAFGRLAQNSEITAMKAAGIPLKRLVWPVVLVGALLSGVCFLAQDQGRPWAYRQLTRLLKSDIPLRLTIDMLPTGVMHAYGDWRVYIGKNEGGTLQDIALLQPLPGGRATAFYAKEARLDKKPTGETVLVMRNGVYIQPNKGALGVTRVEFQELEKSVPHLPQGKTDRAYEGMPLTQLLQEEGRLNLLFKETAALPVARELRSLRLEVTDRLSFSLMCLAVSLVAAPIGARTRRSGRSYTFAWGFFIIASYFILRKALEVEALLPLSACILIGQIPNLILGAFGTLLTWRVDRI